MDLEKLINIIKSENFISIDYTQKIKKYNDFVKFQIEKINKTKYNKVVFILHVYYLPVEVKVLLFKCNFIPLIINKSFTLLLNKDNYLFLDLSNMNNIHNNTILNFLNDDDGKNTVCNICCNSTENLILCCRCAYNMCYECQVKMKSNLCPVCKYNIGSCIKIN